MSPQRTITDLTNNWELESAKSDIGPKMVAYFGTIGKFPMALDLGLMTSLAVG